MRFAIRMFLLVAILIWPTLASADPKLPKFSGVYVIQKGEWVEVAKIKEMEINLSQSPSVFGEGSYGNKRELANYIRFIPKNKFFPVNATALNKSGFIVMMDNWGSENYELHRVPNIDDLPDRQIYDFQGIAIDISTVSLFNSRINQIVKDPPILNGLCSPRDGEFIPLKKGKEGADAHLFVPEQSIKKGFYYILKRSVYENFQTMVYPIEIK